MNDDVKVRFPEDGSALVEISSKLGVIFVNGGDGKYSAIFHQQDKVPEAIGGVEFNSHEDAIHASFLFLQSRFTRLKA